MINILRTQPCGGEENLTLITFYCKRQIVMDLSNHSKSTKIFYHHQITTDQCCKRLKAVAPRELKLKLDHRELKHRYSELIIISPMWHLYIGSRITPGQKNNIQKPELPIQFLQYHFLKQHIAVLP